MSEPYLRLTASEFLLKKGLMEKEIEKILHQERFFIKKNGIPNYFEENKGCTLVQISLDEGMVLFDKNHDPIVILNEKGKEITDTGYFALTVDLVAENELAVVLGTSHETWEGFDYPLHYQLMRANHWDEVNTWLRKHLHHSLEYLLSAIEDKGWNENTSEFDRLTSLYPELFPIAEKAITSIQDTFAFNGEDNDANEVLPDDTLSLIEQELTHCFDAKIV